MRLSTILPLALAALISDPLLAADAISADGFESALAPMPLLSRGKETASSTGDATAVVDGVYFGGATWNAQPPAWVAIRVGAGPSRAMLSFVVYPGTEPPADYRIETSTDSTDGADGTWTIAADVAGNDAPARAHPFDFAARTWVRFVVTRAQTADGSIAMDEIDVHDASAGNDDTWMFVGDSITAMAFGRSLGADDFAERVHAAAPAYFPLMIGAGVGGTSTVDGVAQIDHWLALHPDIRNWVIGYGTNDSASGDPRYATDYGARLRTIVERLRAAGKNVLVPRIPYKLGGEAYLAPYNAEVDAVRVEYRLGAAPDFYAWFLAHPEQLADGVHPNDAGARAMNALWADAARALYP